VKGERKRVAENGQCFSDQALQGLQSTPVITPLGGLAVGLELQYGSSGGPSSGQAGIAILRGLCYAA
jgi:hypothetical protein